MNVYLAGKRLDEVPHPKRTVLLADCLSPDGRIDGPEDIDWTRHEGRCIVRFCDLSEWRPDAMPRDHLIFNPWPAGQVSAMLR